MNKVIIRLIYLCNKLHLRQQLANVCHAVPSDMRGVPSLRSPYESGFSMTVRNKIDPPCWHSAKIDEMIFKCSDVIGMVVFFRKSTLARTSISPVHRPTTENNKMTLTKYIYTYNVNKHNHCMCLYVYIYLQANKSAVCSQLSLAPPTKRANN